MPSPTTNTHKQLIVNRLLLSSVLNITQADQCSQNGHDTLKQIFDRSFLTYYTAYVLATC
jgi:hypothetical protein